jgi:hypothetical protein
MQAIRRVAAMAVLVGAGLVAGAGPVGAASDLGCMPGYGDPGPVTLAEGLALPRIQAGLAQDPAPYTVEDLNGLFGAIDVNGDGLLCMKSVSNLAGNSAKHHGFFYLAMDNKHPS